MGFWQQEGVKVGVLCCFMDFFSLNYMVNKRATGNGGGFQTRMAAWYEHLISRPAGRPPFLLFLLTV